MTAWADWPYPYELNRDPLSPTPPAPGWTRAATVAVGKAMAETFLTDPGFARSYYNVVAAYMASPDDYTVRYGVVIGNVPGGSAPRFNAHDFANVHHTAWLHLLRALVSLTNQNIHGDNGDPPPNGTTHRDPEQVFGVVHAEWFHNIPNANGSFAITTQDVSAANAGI